MGVVCKLRVNGLGGPLCVVNADHTWLVEKVKAVITDTVQVPPQAQRLYIGATELLDDDQPIGIHICGESIDICLLRRSPEELEWLAKIANDWSVIRNAPEDYRADPSFVRYAVKINGAALEHASLELQSNPDLALLALHDGGFAFISGHLWENREFVLKVVRGSGVMLKFAALGLRREREIAFAAVNQNWRALQFVPHDQRTDVDMLLCALKQDWRAVELVPKGMWNDRAFVSAAVAFHDVALQYASADLRADRELVALAVRQNGLVLGYSSREFWEDIELAIVAVKQNGLALRVLADELRADRDLVLLAVKQNGEALQYASEELRADREVVVAAVKRSGQAVLKHSSSGKLRAQLRI